MNQTVMVLNLFMVCFIFLLISFCGLGWHVNVQVPVIISSVNCSVAKDPKPFLLIDFSEYLSINV